MEMSSLSRRLPVLLLFPCCRLGGPEQRCQLRAEIPGPPVNSWQKPPRSSNHPRVLLLLTRIPEEFLILKDTDSLSPHTMLLPGVDPLAAITVKDPCVGERKPAPPERQRRG